MPQNIARRDGKFLTGETGTAIENPDGSFPFRWFGRVDGVRPGLPGGGGEL
jgi:hypothetical protein